MRGLRTALTGLGTRVATRTFLTFALCAIAPIVLLAFMSHYAVSARLSELAAERLARTSKSYGLLLFERLSQSEELLIQMADAQLLGATSAADLRGFDSRVLRIVDVRTHAPTDEAASGARLQVRREDDGVSTVAIRVTRVRENTAVTLTGVLHAAGLWDADAVASGGVALCVRDEAGAQLNCTGETIAGESLSGAWTLFLRPVYGGSAWKIEARQSSVDALTSVHEFSRILLLAAGMAIALALLFSVIQIRRSHRPLAVLAEAAARIGARRAANPIVLDGDDEYGSLALAFNHMAASVTRQFRLLGALARIDRMILASPAIGAVLERTLPDLPRLTRTRMAAVLLLQEAGADALLYVVHRDDRVRVRRVLIAAEEVKMLLHDGLPRSARLESLRTELLAASKCSAFGAAPIRIDRRLRGALLLAHAGEAQDGAARRHARAFARRFAVALGVEERRQALLRQAYYDELTGLPNRQLFRDRLQQEIAHGRRTGECVALIYIDLDRFKNVNDSLGHTAGDQLLRLVSARLAGVVRDTDTLARLGGDEFVVIASTVAEAPAHVLGERLQAALGAAVNVGEVDCFVEASMGIAVSPQDGTTADQLLRNADTAMYRAKAAGGGRAVYYEESMNRDATRRMHIEQRLRVALARGALTLAYQPKIRTHDGAISGVEALARWSDAELGVVSPADFIPVAEECGLIDELGEWAVREACTAFEQWRRQGVDVGHVSVNVSVRQLRDERFVRRVQHVLLETQIAPSALELEVTESTLADSPRRTAAVLDELRRLGVRIAIDDFGVGYSSMAALGNLPADVLKIDRSFIEHCATRVDSASIVEAIISMAHALGKLTVAEGVENEQQLARLQALGCDVAQGYFYSRALPAAEIPRFAASRRPSLAHAGGLGLQKLTCNVKPHVRGGL